MPSSACRSEEHTSELQSLRHLVCRLLLEKNNSRTLGVSCIVPRASGAHQPRLGSPRLSSELVEWNDVPRPAAPRGVGVPFLFFFLKRRPHRSFPFSPTPPLPR